MKIFFVGLFLFGVSIFPVFSYAEPVVAREVDISNMNPFQEKDDLIVFELPAANAVVQNADGSISLITDK